MEGHQGIKIIALRLPREFLEAREEVGWCKRFGIRPDIAICNNRGNDTCPIVLRLIPKNQALLQCYELAWRERLEALFGKGEIKAGDCPEFNPSGPGGGLAKGSADSFFSGMVPM